MGIENTLRADVARHLKEKGKTQKDFAEETGIRPDSFNHWYNGRRSFPVKHIDAIRKTINQNK